MCLILAVSKLSLSPLRFLLGSGNSREGSFVTSGHETATVARTKLERVVDLSAFLYTNN